MEKSKPKSISADSTHRVFMQRCIDLALLGSSYTSPNPMVGAVVVHNGVIIGEGWHRKYGESHAEVNAIQSVKDPSLLSSSTLYVSLEPCAHYGKTPPCASLIIKHKIPKVVIGCIDTFSKVSGKGILMLKESGIEVLSGVMEHECRILNKRFFCFHEKKRPYIILKWAQSADGFIDKKREINTISKAQPNWITNATTKRLVHKWRAEEDAILIGRRTAQNDNPSLTTRVWPGENPTRILIDQQSKIGDSYHLMDDKNPTIVISEVFKKDKTQTSYVQINFSPLDLDLILKKLHEKNILSVIIEGGCFTLQSFIKKNLWDEARVLIGAVSFKEGLKAPMLDLPYHEKELDKDYIRFYKNQL